MAPETALKAADPASMAVSMKLPVAVSAMLVSAMLVSTMLGSAALDATCERPHIPSRVGVGKMSPPARQVSGWMVNVGWGVADATEDATLLTAFATVDAVAAMDDASGTMVELATPEETSLTVADPTVLFGSSR